MKAPSPALWPRAPRTYAPSVQYLCPRCEEMFLLAVDDGAGGQDFRCAHCRLELQSGAPAPREGEPVSRCWVCGNRELYVQKDFNRELGFMIVLSSAMIVFLIMLLIGHIEGIFCLLAIALVDWIVYRKLADVTVCYLCQSIYRGFPLNEAHRGFYLGNEEKYKALRQEWLKARLGEAS